jgi:hypothetical protein
MVCQAGATELAVGWDWGVAVVPIASVDITLSFPILAILSFYRQWYSLML